MKKFAVAAALLSAVVATPALAQNGEGHVEVRGGYITGSGLDDATLGVAGGYDYNLGDKAFAGVEIAGDKISLREVQKLRSGQIINLGCRPTDAVRIVTDTSDQPVALGELVDIEGQLGVRLTRIFI